MHYVSFAPIFIIACCCASALAQSVDTVTRLPGKSIEIIALRPSDLPTIDPRSVEIKPASELTRISGSYLASDALELLSSSLDVREYGSLGGIALPSFRGLPPEYTIVYRDGVRLTNEQLGETDLGQLTLHGISTVELLPASSAIELGGDAIGSAINLVSDIADSNTVTVGTEQTDYDGASGIPTESYYAKASLKLEPSLSIIAGGSLDASTGAFPFYQDSAHPNVLRDNNDAALRSANLAALWTASGNTSIRLLGNYFYANRGVPGAITTEGVGASDFTARQTDAQSFAAIKADHDDGALASTFSLAYERQFESYNDPEETHPNDSAWNTSLDAAARGSYAFGHAVEGFGGVEEEHTTLNGNTNTMNGDSIIGRFRTSAYAAAKYLPFDNLDANGSIRVENISDRSLTELLPQGAIHYSPISYLTLGGAYSKSFHAPTLNDLYWYQGGNPNLKPEHGDNAQASIAYNHAWSDISLSLNATAFLAHIQDEIIWEPYLGEEYSPINIGEVESKGIEFRADGHWSIDAETLLHLEESYTWLDAKNITPGDENNGNEIPYSSPTRSVFVAEIDRQNFGSLSIFARYRGHEFSDPANTITGKLQPVTTFDVTLASRRFSLFGAGVALSFSIVDLTNEHYEEVIDYPLPSRTYNLSIELTYD